EDERDGHADPLGGQAADRRNALGRGGDLDHHVGPADQLGQADPLLDGPVRVGGVLGQELERDAPVDALAGLVDRQEQVARATDVLDGQRFIDLRRRAPLEGQLAQRLFVVGRRDDGALEDGRVRGEAPQPLVDQAGQRARAQQPATHVVVPDALTDVVGLMHPGSWAGHLDPLSLRRWKSDSHTATRRGARTKKTITAANAAVAASASSPGPKSWGPALRRPTRYGPTNPPRQPVELMSPMAAAPGAPDVNQRGIAQKDGMNP